MVLSVLLLRGPQGQTTALTTGVLRRGYTFEANGRTGRTVWLPHLVLMKKFQLLSSLVVGEQILRALWFILGALWSLLGASWSLLRALCLAPLR